MSEGALVDTLILPGLNGSPSGHWQAHWAAEHPEARMLIQEDWSCPRLEDWLFRLEEALSVLDAVWLVAHSLGAILAANLADRLSAAKVKGALLVAPSDLDHVEALHPCIVRFGTMPGRRLPFPSLVVASRNDPYMPFDAARHYARLWGSDLADLGHVGHINIASGFGRWSHGQALLDRLRSASRPSRPPKTVPLALVQSRSSPRSRLGS